MSSNGTKGAAKWKEVIIGGISGIALGSAGTLFASNMPSGENAENADSSESDSEVDSTDTTNNQSESPASAPMASSVNDSMSFSQAFSAARSEVGPGGVFEWHGNLYGTYYASEWNNMDAAARDQYYNTVHWNSHSHSSENTHNVSSNDSTNTNHHNETTTTTTNTPHKEEDDPDVEIIGVDHANLDGEHDSIIGAASINGHNVYFVDIDGQDDEFEIMISDTNGNGQVDEGEAIDISEQHMSVSHFENLAHASSANHQEEEQVQYYANNDDLPDYVNDADPGNLA